jgi:hypothetical protein
MTTATKIDPQHARLIGANRARIKTMLAGSQLSTALDVARNTARDYPWEESRILLRETYLSVIDFQIQRQGGTKDARTILAQAESIVFDEPSWWESLAIRRAQLGELSKAYELLEKVPGSPLKAKLPGLIADRAMTEPAANAFLLLQAEHHPAYQAVRKAFEMYEKGQDDAAREALNGVGISSPFLEWKLLLRGFLAWSAGDDAKAQENWARLTDDRLPAKMAAPFRFATDKGFAARQTPADATNLSKKSASILTVSEPLERIRVTLATDFIDIKEAIFAAGRLVDDWKKSFPHLLPKLADALYWAVALASEDPGDMDRYKKVFGPPPEDPNFDRLQAIVMEQCRDQAKAQSYWKKYIEWMRKTPDKWPEAQAKLAQVLIFERMAIQSKDDESDDDDFDDDDDLYDEFGPFGADPFQKMKKKFVSRGELNPVQCLRKSIELDPDRVWPWKKLLDELLENAAYEAARPVAETLRTKFAHDLGALTLAGRFFDAVEEPVESIDCVRKALAINPLDRTLRTVYGNSLLENIRGTLAEGGDAAVIRESLAEAMKYTEGRQIPIVLALSAMLELKAKNEAGFEESLQKLTALPDLHGCEAYLLHVEGTRLKVGKPRLKPYSDTFKEILDDPAYSPRALAFFSLLMEYKTGAKPYHGFKSHEKKVLDRIVLWTKTLSEENGQKIAYLMHGRKLWKPLVEVAVKMRRRFPTNAHFFFLEAEGHFGKQRTQDSCQRLAGGLYLRAKMAIEEAKDGRYSDVRRLLDERIRQTPDIGYFTNPFSNFSFF